MGHHGAYVRLFCVYVPRVEEWQFPFSYCGCDRVHESGRDHDRVRDRDRDRDRDRGHARDPGW